ncbi:MAG: citrate lyase subunit beta/citryl-CoA lyase [Verrucomicrobiales bacterium]|jgi:citrate lyase subunit beta/citryl-CoA lyase
MLFGPAQRTDFVTKFAASGADIGVLDLEDATPEAAKGAAREAIVEARPGDIELGEMLLFVRTNSLGSHHFAEDVLAAAAAGAHGLVVPKLETNREVGDVRREMASSGLSKAMLCAGIESVAGVYQAVEVAGAGCDLVYFGAEDFITDLGGVRTESNTEVLYARSRVAIAARLAGIPALDQVVVDYGDDARFTREAIEARTLGFSGKLCIHPSQVGLAVSAFTPSDEEMAWAAGIVAAAEVAESLGNGVVSYEGTMVDAPIVLRARNLLRQFSVDL